MTWLSFADRLMEFPTALLGVALGTVLLPSLSAAHARADQDGYSGLLDWGLRLVLMLGLPAALGLALLSDGLVATLFHYGAFQAQDVQQTRLAVIAYSAGLIGLLAIKILAPGFYAKQDIRTPVKIAIMVLVLTQLLNAILVPWLAHAGLALAIGLGACINALALLTGLRRRGVYRPGAGWGVSCCGWSRPWRPWRPYCWPPTAISTGSRCSRGRGCAPCGWAACCWPACWPTSGCCWPPACGHAISPAAAPVGACNISIDTHVEIVKITTKTGPYGRSLHLLDRHL